jgi:hypothetical protein
MPAPVFGPADEPPRPPAPWRLRAVDLARAAVIAVLAALLWDELVVRAADAPNADTAYRAGFLFVAVLVAQVVRRGRRQEPSTPAAPTPESPKDSP